MMAKSKKAETKPAASEAAPTFEESLAQIEQIVNELEEGTLGLDESIGRFEKGMVLLRACYHTLQRAEQKIEILTAVDDQGNPTTAPFDATATIKQANQSAGKRRQKREAGESVAAGQNGEDDDDLENMLF